METMTREMAWAMATDEGNRSMRRAGRMTWNQDDFNAAAKMFNRLWPEKWEPPIYRNWDNLPKEKVGEAIDEVLKALFDRMEAKEERKRKGAN